MSAVRLTWLSTFIYLGRGFKDVSRHIETPVVWTRTYQTRWTMPSRWILTRRQRFDWTVRILEWWSNADYCQLRSLDPGGACTHETRIENETRRHFASPVLVQSPTDMFASSPVSQCCSHRTILLSWRRIHLRQHNQEGRTSPVPANIVVLGALYPLSAHSCHSSPACCISAVVCSRRHSLLHGTSHLSSWKCRHPRFLAIESRSAAAASRSSTSRSSASARTSSLFSCVCSHRLSQTVTSRPAAAAPRSTSSGSSTSACPSRPLCYDASDEQPQWIPTALASCTDPVRNPTEETNARNTSLWRM